MIEYGYAESGWKDQLTSYDGDSITYDAIGNPLTYRDGMTMTWEGRQLSSLTRSGTTSTYKYDADGLRIKKTAGSLATVYQYVNGQLLRERRSNGVVLRYMYDALGNLSCIRYTNIDNWTKTFFVRCTANGDVSQIYDTSGNFVASYTYDAWGNTVAITDANGNAITASTHVAVVNPIRYRGYYWDAETGFYYLQNRYFDPEIKRCISADTTDILTATPMELTDKNLFAYCDNNPVMREDKGGQFWNIVAGAVVGAALGAGFEIANQILSGKSLSSIDWVSVGIEAVSGAATGVLLSVGASAVAVAVGKTVINTATSVAHSINQGDSMSDTVIDASKTAVTTLVASSASMIGNKMTSGRHAKLGFVGRTTKRFTRNAFKTNRVATERVKSIIDNRTCRGSLKAAKYVLSDYWRIYNTYRRGRC